MQIALLVVEDAVPDGLAGRLVDHTVPMEEWLEVEVRFVKSPRNRLLCSRTQSELDAEENSRRADFERLRATVHPRVMLRLENARGDFDPATNRGYLAAYGACEVCAPAETSKVLALPMNSPAADGEVAFWQPASVSPFSQRIAALADPDRDPETTIVDVRLLSGEAWEGECAETKVRHQPDEGLVYVIGPDIAYLLAPHGAYLFYSDGTDCNELGLRGLPEAPGVYYFTGSPWRTGPDHDGEYDSGMDVIKAVPATAEHYAPFGADAESYSEAIAEYDADHAVDSSTPVLF